MCGDTNSWISTGVDMEYDATGRCPFPQACSASLPQAHWPSPEMLCFVLNIWSWILTGAILLGAILGLRTSSTVAIGSIPETLYEATALIGIIHPQTFTLKLPSLCRSQSWSVLASEMTLERADLG